MLLRHNILRSEKILAVPGSGGNIPTMKTTRATAKRLNGADRRWGYEFGCDGRLTSAEAMSLTGYSRTHLYWLWNNGKVRMAKSGGRCQWCKRSLVEYTKPVEV